MVGKKYWVEGVPGVDTGTMHELINPRLSRDGYHRDSDHIVPLILYPNGNYIPSF